MKWHSWGQLGFLAALWGGSFLFIRVAAPVLGPVWLIEARVLLAGLTLLPLLLYQNLGQQLWRHWRLLLVIGAINSALPFLLFAYASLALPAGYTAIFNGATPFFGALVAAIGWKEPITRRRILGFSVGFLGLVTLVGWRPLATTDSFWLAAGAALLAGIFYAVAAPYIKLTCSHLSVGVVTAGSQLGAALILLPFLPLAIPHHPLTQNVVLSVLGLAVLSTALAYMIYLHLIQTIGATRTLTVTYIIPVFAMLWGLLFLGEPITPGMIVSSGLIILGTALANTTAEKSLDQNA